MSESCAPTIWETLPRQRQRGVVLLLGQMALRQIRSASIAQETANDGWGPCVEPEGGPAREDPSRASRTLGDRLYPAVHGSADRASPGVDAAAICPCRSRLPVRVGTRDHPHHR